MLLGASYIFTIGKRYEKQASDTINVPIRIPLFEYKTFEEYKNNLPVGCMVVPVEQGQKPLCKFGHPKLCSYLLGSETEGLPNSILQQCKEGITVESVLPDSYNVATAGAIVMYARYCNRNKLTEDF
jgi:tRNA (guanosine-2'-O-)-methyltransferase